jgi:hypothetical protein
MNLISQFQHKLIQLNEKKERGGEDREEPGDSDIF